MAIRGGGGQGGDGKFLLKMGGGGGSQEWGERLVFEDLDVCFMQ